jgi:hypothetical protein
MSVPGSLDWGKFVFLCFMLPVSSRSLLQPPKCRISPLGCNSRERSWIVVERHFSFDMIDNKRRLTTRASRIVNSSDIVVDFVH